MPILIRYLFPEIFLTSQKSFGYGSEKAYVLSFYMSRTVLDLTKIFELVQNVLEMDQKAIILSGSK